MIEHLTRTQADRLANRIAEYWVARGYQRPAMRLVETRIIPGSSSELSRCWGVRSDMIGGLPRK